VAYALKSPPPAHESLNRILDTDKELWVVNMRPLWNKYAPKGHDSQAEERRVLESLTAMIGAHKAGRRFVFLPMNADQFGFSDLECAYRLGDMVKAAHPDADYVVWEYEPDIDSTLTLLRRARLCVSMRFHACLFAIACGTPAIGIDYSSASNAKVSALFRQAGLEARVLAIGDITPESLNGMVAKATTARGA
jgi:polysaccharide pyruvyl transferase WcaK-like protein